MAVQPLIMPKLGAYTEDVLLSAWLVPEGEEVAAGTAVFELETDKTTAEVEAETAGWVHHHVPAGQHVPIGSTVGVIAATRTEYESIASPLPDLAGKAEPAGSATTAIEAPKGDTDGGPSPGSRPRRGGPLVSPRARALLRKLGHDVDVVAEITATGPNGRIVDRDVAAWASARTAAATAAPAPAGLTVRTSIPLRGRRGTIASRMVSSLQTSAQLTSVLELDVKPLVAFRTAFNATGAGPRVGVTAIVVKLVAASLRAHPLLNARVTDTAVELLEEVNIAIAVETDDGLVAPVLRHADRLTLSEIAAGIEGIASRSRAGTLQPDELLGGTFTVSNGGIHPVDITTAILNPPQTGILWIGRIRERPVVVGDGAIAVHPTMQACLTFDHRAVDGGPAAAFLGTLERLIAALPELPT